MLETDAYGFSRVLSANVTMPRDAVTKWLVDWPELAFNLFKPQQLLASAFVRLVSRFPFRVIYYLLKLIILLGTTNPLMNLAMAVNL